MGLSNYLPSSRLIQPGVCTSTTRPASPFNGQVIYETDTKQTLVWQGSSWVMLTDADTPPGLVLLKTQAVGSTAVTSVQITDAFSSAYDNYRITFSSCTPTATDSWRIKFGSSTSGCYGSLYYDAWDGSANGILRAGNAASTYVCLNEANTNNASTTFDVIAPNLAQKTQFFGNYSGRGIFGWFGGLENTTTQFTSFTLLVDGAGTMTGGTIRVYGYRNSI